MTYTLVWAEKRRGRELKTCTGKLRALSTELTVQKRMSKEEHSNMI